MKQRERTRNGGKAGEALLALTPLLAVVAAIVFLAFAGAGSDRAGKTGAPVMAQVKPANVPGAESSAASEEAAAAAVVAISLARVAPPLPEDALDPPRPAPPPAGANGSAGASGDAARKPAPRRDAAGAAQTAGQTAGQSARQSVAQAPAGPPMQIAQGEQPAKKPEDPGILERIGSYAPSPARIANAVSDGVSKLASYIPGL